MRLAHETSRKEKAVFFELLAYLLRRSEPREKKSATATAAASLESHNVQLQQTELVSYGKRKYLQFGKGL
jgi:hypothetical protein